MIESLWEVSSEVLDAFDERNIVDGAEEGGHYLPPRLSLEAPDAAAFREPEAYLEYLHAVVTNDLRHAILDSEGYFLNGEPAETFFSELLASYNGDLNNDGILDSERRFDRVWAANPSPEIVYSLYQEVYGLRETITTILEHQVTPAS